MDTARELSLAEELLLVLHRAHDGKPLVTEVVLDAALAGAVLADLALANRIDLSGGKLTVSDPAATGEPECDALLARISGEPKPRTAQWWVERTKSGALRKRILHRLGTRGVVRERSRRLLGVLTIRRYPHVAPEPGASVQARLDAAVRGATAPGGTAPGGTAASGTVDQRTAVLIGLIDACGLTRRRFPDADKRRIKQIVENVPAAGSVRAVVRSVQLATAASIGVMGAAAAAGAASG